MIGKVIPLTDFGPFFWLVLLLTIWQGDTFDQFWTFFELILLLTTWQGDTFDHICTFFCTYITLDYFAKVLKDIWPALKLFADFTKGNWQGDTFDQFWTFFGLILLLITWQGDTFVQFWTFFWTYITFDYLVEVLKDIWLVLKLFSDFTCNCNWW